MAWMTEYLHCFLENIQENGEDDPLEKIDIGRIKKMIRWNPPPWAQLMSCEDDLGTPGI